MTPSQQALNPEELKACPFECGNEHLSISRHPTSSYVFCDNCGACGPSAYGHMKPGNDSAERDAKAVAAWNTRALSLPPDGWREEKPK